MQKSNSKSYLNRYGDDGVYSGLEYGAPVISIGIYAALHLGRELPQEAKVLCVGWGNGYEVVAHLISGRDAYGTELHVIRDVPILKNRIIKAMTPELPFKDKTFDAVQCCEVLEHIPEELTLPFMRECLRVGEKVLFTAALKDDPPWHTHINLHKPQWWLDRLDELGCSVLNFQYNVVFENPLKGALCSRYTPAKVLMYVS